MEPSHPSFESIYNKSNGRRDIQESFCSTMGKHETSISIDDCYGAQTVDICEVHITISASSFSISTPTTTPTTTTPTTKKNLITTSKYLNNVWRLLLYLFAGAFELRFPSDDTWNMQTPISFFLFGKLAVWFMPTV